MPDFFNQRNFITNKAKLRCCNLLVKHNHTKCYYIQVADTSLSQLDRLEHADLSRNRLTTLKQAAVDNLARLADSRPDDPQAASLRLAHNSLCCTCDIIWMRGSNLIQVQCFNHVLVICILSTEVFSI